MSGFRVSPSHFAERFGLIVIIALGESIVAIGAGLDGDPLTGGVIVAAVAGLAVAAAQWWAYFDVVALVAERKLAEAEGIERNRLARDSWGVLHGLLIAGIILTALGVKKTVGDVDVPLEGGARGGALRRGRGLPARACRDPVSQHPLAQPPAGASRP